MRRSRVLVWCVLAGVGAFVTAGCSSGPPGGASGGPATLPSYATVDLDDLGAIPWGTYADASAEQKAQLTDGEVTYDEYKAAFGRMRACIQQRAGVDLVVTGEANEVIDAGTPDAAESAYETCYPKEFAFVDAAWQQYRENFSAEANALAECLRERGVTPALTELERWDQVSALGMDPRADCVWKKIPADAPPSS